MFDSVVPHAGPFNEQLGSTLNDTNYFFIDAVNTILAGQINKY